MEYELLEMTTDTAGYVSARVIKNGIRQGHMTSFSVCVGEGGCGSLIADEALHDKFHKRMNVDDE